MFGYVIANIDKLTEEENEQYRSCYCGLCKSLGKNYGSKGRITLSYDMTFLILLISSIDEDNTKIETERCVFHPMKPHKSLHNEITNYAADMNIALAYYNFLDDWNDDKNILSKGKAKLFEHEVKTIQSNYPRQCNTTNYCLNKLGSIEKAGELNPDIPANCFGTLMGEIFVIKEDEYANSLRDFGRCLGKFIYIMDACIDLKEDLTKERYNPMVTTSSESFTDVLDVLMANCIQIYNKLPIKQYKGILDNILYSGVWSKFEAMKQKTKESQK
ncbi:MAG: DUF5685 family protein [Sedimentibacter sp.]